MNSCLRPVELLLVHHGYAGKVVILKLAVRVVRATHGQFTDHSAALLSRLLNLIIIHRLTCFVHTLLKTRRIVEMLLS